MTRWRARRWQLRRRAAGLLTALALVAATCTIEGAPSPTDEQWRLPSHGEVVASAVAPRPAAAVQQRLHTCGAPALAVSVTDAPRHSPHLVTLARRRDGSLPPARQRYRRVVHDDRSDLPA